MFVKEIKLIAFRNYLEADLKLEKQKTIIIGKNAQGKSNLLEVIQILSQFKSRRARRDSELINFNLDQAIIKLKIQQSNLDTDDDEIAVLIRKSGKRTYKLNGNIKKPKELMHKILSVSFMSEDLNIINSSPSVRRDYLDSVVKQLSFSYAEELSKFEKTLSQRNSFLKSLVEQGKYYTNSLSGSDKTQLEIWDDLFIDQANIVTSFRESFLEQLKPKANTFYNKIAQGIGSLSEENKLDFEYQGSMLNKAVLSENLAKDLARGYSNLGPHRDDFVIKLNESEAISFASQGEKRSIMLAVKLSELELLQEEHDDYPILLLDDVLAELDEDRQDFLLEAVNSKCQVIITTTHLGSHLEKWSDDSQIVEIDSGEIIRSNLKLQDKEFQGV